MTNWGSDVAKDTEIVGTVKRVVFEKNDFVIATLRDGPDVKGSASAGELKSDLTYRFMGKMTHSEKYGDQFVFSSYSMDVPHEQDGVVAYLKKTAAGSGLGVVAAGRLWDAFGPSAIDVLVKEPARAVAAGCVTEKVAVKAGELLKKHAESQKTRIDLTGIFNGLGFSGALIGHLVAAWGVDAPRIVREDPFRLLFESMPGCGFARVDHLHHRLGHPHTNPRRMMALAWSRVHENSDGHTWLAENEIVRRMGEEVGYDSDPEYGVQRAFDAGLITRYTDQRGNNWLALPSRARAEADIAEGLARLMARPVEHWPSVDSLTELGEHQRDVIRPILASPVGILTGTPGTGKTYSSATIIKHARRLVPPDEIAVVAPTGKAAVRITKAMHEYGIHIEATTVHRLLEIAGQNRDGFYFKRNQGNPVPYRIVVLDEASMLDADLAAALLSALAPGTHLLLIGDPYQLPPVGHGMPLRDLIRAGVPYGELTEIRRNSGMIVQACQDIKNGLRYKTCDKFDDAGNNFRSIEAADNATILENIRAICRRLQAKAVDEPGLDPVEDVQVLCVVNEQSELGRYNLNRVLQAELNPGGQGGDAHPFRVGDKVICLNNRQMPVMDPTPGEPPDRFDAYFKTSAERKERYIANGDMGRVLAVSPKALIVQFRHPDRVVLVGLPGAGKARPDDDGNGNESGGFGPIDLGYAVTTHRSQGSEWPYVIIPIDESERTKRIVSRELLYTAISRAKKRCIMIGRRAVADEWCHTVIMLKRKTFLQDRVRDALSRMMSATAPWAGVAA